MPTLNPWVILGIVLLWIASLIGVGYWRGEEATKIERGDWEKREAGILANDNAEIIAANAKKDANEKANEQIVADITTKFEKENKDEKAKSDVVIAELRGSNAGLFYHLASTSGAVADASSKTGSSASGSDGSGTVELPPEIAGNLYSEADRADGIVRKLSACQALVIEDRKLCGK